MYNDDYCIVTAAVAIYKMGLSWLCTSSVRLPLSKAQDNEAAYTLLDPVGSDRCGDSNGVERPEADDLHAIHL